MVSRNIVLGYYLDHQFVSSCVTMNKSYRQLPEKQDVSKDELPQQLSIGLRKHLNDFFLVSFACYILLLVPLIL